MEHHQEATGIAARENSRDPAVGSSVDYFRGNVSIDGKLALPECW